MTARQLFQAGKLNDAIEALGAEVRDNPTDAQRRTFLFELLCFAGLYDRAEKHLDVLAGGGPESGMGALVYRSALHAEKIRKEMFSSGQFPLANAGSNAITGTLNGQPFQTLQDGDPRLGPRLELFAAGQYMWVPLEHIESIKIEAPKRLRDMLWAPAIVRTGPEFKGQELGEVLLPILTPLAYQHSDDAVRLGRATEWVETADGEAAPAGQKMLLVDDEEFPFLEIRDLEIHAAQKAAS
jgi:type VI secretion system protein ImpE